MDAYVAAVFGSRSVRVGSSSHLSRGVGKVQRFARKLIFLSLFFMSFLGGEKKCVPVSINQVQDSD